MLLLLSQQDGSLTVLRRIGSPIPFPEANKFCFRLRSNMASLVVLNSDKESSCQCRRYKSDPWGQNTHWGRKLQPTPVFLPEKSHEQRRLAGYSPWGRKESDVIKRLNDNSRSIASLLLPEKEGVYIPSLADEGFCFVTKNTSGK